MVMRLWLVRCLLAAILASSCGMLGDPGIQVVYVNETANQVTVFPDGRDRPAYQYKISASQSFKTAILASGTHPEIVVAQVEAVDPAGTLVFCHAYTYAELQKLDGFIRIRSGELDCH
jgi:hypothetical protein